MRQPRSDSNMISDSPFPLESSPAPLQSSGEAVARGRVAKLASPVAMATPVLKIATFHSSSLGSLVASFPALMSLRESFPGARICSFVDAPLLPLLRNFGAVDEAQARPRGGLSAQAALMARLHGADFDLALSFSQGSNALLLMLATAAPIRAGFIPSHMDALLTHKTAKDGPLRPVMALELARSIGATSRGHNARDFLHLPLESTTRVQKWLETAGIEANYLVVAPREPRRAARKSGEIEIDAAMINALAARFALVLVGLKSAAPMLLDVGETAHPILDLGGKTDVATLAALCEGARGVFGATRGPLQLARLFEKPVVAIGEHPDPTLAALQTFGF